MAIILKKSKKCLKQGDKMIQKSYDNSPTLYLIPTPIGNMDDLTFRTVDTLKKVEVIFSEDTRVTGNLLKSLNIKKRLISNHEYNETKNYDKIIEFLENGCDVGLASDRGTPVISDPGYEIAKYVISKGYNVVALPGATALIPALITSGIDPMPFTFYGFLNSKDSKRRKELELLKDKKETLIFYEAPHRIKDMLKDLLNIFGDRKISVAREITKKFEEVTRGNISEIIGCYEEPKGEFVVIIEGNKNVEKKEEIDIIEQVNKYISTGKTTTEAIKIVALENNISKNIVYNKYHKKGD